MDAYPPPSQQSQQQQSLPQQPLQQPSYPPQQQAPQQPYYQQQPQSYPQAYYPPQPPAPDAAKLYEKDLRTRAMKITLSLFGFYFVNIFSVLIVVVSSLVFSGVFSSLFSGALGSVESYPQTYESLMDKVPIGLASIVGIVLGSLMLLITRGTSMFTQDLTTVNNRVHVPNLFKMLGLILGVSAVVSILTTLFLLMQEALGFSGQDPLTDLIGSLVNPMGLLYIVLIGPVFEEIIFRGAILRTLLPFGQNFAIVVSALLFGLYHLILTQGIFAFFVGVILAYCTLRYSIKWAMLLHILNNGLAMLITLWAPNVYVELGIYGLYLLLGIMALIVSLPAIREQIHTGKPAQISEVVGSLPLSAPFGQAPVPLGQAPATFGQQSCYAQPGVYPQQVEAKPRPWAILFTSPWLLVGLVIAGLISVAMIF